MTRAEKIKAAREACKAAERPAWKAYEAVMRPAWEAYEAAERDAVDDPPEVKKEDE